MAGEGVSLRMVPGELEQALCLDWALEETGRNGMPPRLIPQCGEGTVDVEHHFPGAVHSALPGAGLAPAFPWSPIHLFFSYRSRRRLRKSRLLTRLTTGHRGGGGRGSWVRARM